MPNQRVGKAVALEILRILEEHTDEIHEITQPELIKKLEFKDIHVTRNTVYTAIDKLIDAGYEIERPSGKRRGYRLMQRVFSPVEASLLLHSVYALRDISSTEADLLIRKIMSTQSRFFRQAYRMLTLSRSNLKTENESVLENFKVIDEAIRENRMLIFTYNRYDTEKRLAPYGKLKRSVIPHGIVLKLQHFYLLANYVGESEQLSFRLDRMTDMEKGEFLEEKVMEELFNTYDETRGNVYMYGGKKENVKLLIDKNMISHVIDYFGNDIRVTPYDDTQVLVRISHVNTEGLAFWALQYVAYCTILSPQSVVVKIDEYLKIGLEKYAKERN